MLFVLSLLTYSFIRGADATEFETALSKTITDFEKNIRMIGDHNVNILN
ncbi:PhnA protein [Roseibium sp. TrichSKD4]|nr:PhnA protein [Roseibium sp. TrichSKD4]